MFFSLRKKHRFYLTFLILPIALFAEILLFFEIFLLILFFVYTFYTNDYKPLIFFISLLTIIIWFQILFDYHKKYQKNLIFIAPIAWILFYIMEFVEYQALIRSISKLIKRQDPVWQKWVRK